MSATKAGKRPLRTLTAHEKLSAIRRVSVGGESKASVARDIGVPESTLRGWCKNQEKISYQVRTSPTNIDESPEHIALLPAKRPKLEEQPYNLCTKTSDGSSGSYSPNSENHFDGGYPKSSENESENSPLNLRTKPDTTSIPISPPKSTTNHEKEREKNKAELARLSSELGLNRPEVFLSNLKNTQNMVDFANMLAHWNSIYQQHMIQQQRALQLTNINKEMNVKLPTSNGLLTTVDKRDNKILPNTEQQHSVHESVSYWLKQQSLMGLSSNNIQQPMLNLNSCLPNKSTMTLATTTSTSATNNSALLSNFSNMATNQTVNQQMLLYNWYKQSTSSAPQNQAVAVQQSSQQPHLSPQQPDKPILYHQLTKEAARNSTDEEVNSENEVSRDDRPKNGIKNRSVLDTLLLNNNRINYETNRETNSLSVHEAIEHGDKFLHWLECCSDPSVTTMQILTLQTLIKNLKASFDRKNGDCQSKTKVRRK